MTRGNIAKPTASIVAPVAFFFFFLFVKGFYFTETLLAFHVAGFHPPP